ncbi:cysteine-rich receptor-like protein kinase 20, partial [Tanacetum coccineum]
MNFLIWGLFLFTSLIFNCDLTTAQDDFWAHDCGDTGYYTRESQGCGDTGYFTGYYKQDLDNVFNSLITRNNGFGFYNSTSGQANAAAFCRGDLEPETCQKCVDKAGRDLRQRCPIQVEAGIWYEACSLRYSNQSMGYGIDDTFWYHSDPNNVSDSSYDIWKQTVTNLLGALQPEAAGGG